jgi:hypothetical protein
MNKFIIVGIMFIISNLIFSVFPFLFPNIPSANIMPYQLWVNAITLFILLLPQSVGSYVYQ